jgi:hypothetical protein
MGKNNFKIWKELIFGISIVILLLPLISAGVGIKWSQESLLVKEGERGCLSYSVYNPWPEETWVKIELSDKLKDLLVEQEAETKFVPANTPSSAAIPVKFCFKVPKVYGEDCWIMGQFICSENYQGELKSYSGEVTVKSVPSPMKVSGAGGSATAMAVSAPLAIKINPDNHARDFTMLFVLIAIISVIIITILLYRRYRKPELENDMTRLKKLKEKIKREKQKK